MPPKRRFRGAFSFGDQTSRRQNPPRNDATHWIGRGNWRTRQVVHRPSHAPPQLVASAKQGLPGLCWGRQQARLVLRSVLRQRCGWSPMATGPQIDAWPASWLLGPCVVASCGLPRSAGSQSRSVPRSLTMVDSCWRSPASDGGMGGNAEAHPYGWALRFLTPEQPEAA